MNSRITVVIPCYNAAPFLCAAVDSALEQTVPPLEVLVIDDGSTDQSAAIAESFGPPVRVISQNNQGESIARNRGIDEARGDWIAFLDADDLWLPDKLARQLAAAGPDVACIHTNYYTFGSSRRRYDLSRCPTAERYSLERFFLGKTILRPSTIMVPRDLPARFPNWTRYGEDTIYMAETLPWGRFVLVNEYLTAIRGHRKSQSAVPGVAAHWHNTFSKWLQRNERLLDPLRVQSLRRKILEHLVQQAYKAYYRKDESDYRLLRRYLEQFAGDATVQRVLEGRIPPFWIFALQWGLDKLQDFLRLRESNVRFQSDLATERRGPVAAPHFSRREKTPALSPGHILPKLLSSRKSG